MRFGFLALIIFSGVADAAGRCGEIAQRPWCNTTLAPQERTNLLLAVMTLAQKAGLMAGDDPFGVVTGMPATGTSDGIPALGIPSLYLSDGPSGPREGKATAFPSPLALGATFNTELAREVGRVISNEVKNKGNDLVHAPTIDIMRTGLAGRTFETYGEDPYLTSRLAVQWIQGSQSEGIMANVKHYALNSQEGQVGVPPLTSLIGGRQLANPQVDERTLREIYLPAFEAAVIEGGSATIMCSYNYVNNSPTCGHKHLLQEVLRDSWGFDGFVLTDYITAAKDLVGSINNGTELEMPIAQFYQPALIHAAVTAGVLSQEIIDTRVGNILRTYFKFGFFDRDDYVSDDNKIDIRGHALVARQVEEQGAVLLQNNGLLPLNAATLHSMAIIGAASDEYHDVGGSASVDPFEFHSPREVLTQRAGPAATVTYNDGSDTAAAAALASTVDVAIIFVADNAQEGVDKTCLSLDCPPIIFLPPTQTPQEDLINAVAAVNPNTVVIMETGGPVLTPWRDRTAAILAAWYPGQEGGAALAAVLFGDSDPSGRTPVSFPNAENETPTAGSFFQYPGIDGYEQYSEGVLIGYRWYDYNKVAPAFPFGHGMSYTTFQYSNLSISSGSGDAVAYAAFDITNTGSRAGTAVPQLYVGMPAPSADVIQPPYQLKGFTRSTLAPGQTTRVEMELNARAFSYWDVAANDWAIAPGCYQIAVGASSRDLLLSAVFPQGMVDCGVTPINDAAVSTASMTRRFGGALDPGTLIMLCILMFFRRRRYNAPK